MNHFSIPLPVMAHARLSLLSYTMLILLGAGLMFAHPASAQGSIPCDYTTDIDRDDDGLIEVCDLEGLDAMRYQLDGSGYRANSSATKITLGCKAGGCIGYELVGDLDFGDAASYSDIADKKAWTSGEGWQPIGDGETPFSTRFDGNGYTLSNLKIDRPNLDYVGLFAATSSDTKIHNVGLLNVNIEGGVNVGSLVGSNTGTIGYSHVVAKNITGNATVGGLVGSNTGTIGYSHALVKEIIGTEGSEVGGLVGRVSGGTINNSYAKVDTMQIDGTSICAKEDSLGKLIDKLIGKIDTDSKIKDSKMASGCENTNPLF